MKTVAKDFYDDFWQKLATDYAYGNPRIESALAFAMSAIPQGASRVLDIGFGLGWSCQEILRHLPTAEVLGIDLSPRLVDLATALCHSDRAKFEQQDLTEWEPEDKRPFDAAVLLDVYEHIPKSARKLFHRGLAKLLTSNSIVILTCPSKRHQDFLRREHPQGLQPIDEDITEIEAKALAADLGLKLLSFESKTIWHDDDYNYIVIGESLRPSKRAISLLSSKERIDRLETRAHVRTHGPDLFSTTLNAQTMCIALPTVSTYSETFIREHIRSLPFNIKLLAGPNLNLDGDTNIFNQNAPARIASRIVRKSQNKDHSRWLTERRANWLKANNVSVVLAEYGPTAVQILESCEIAKVPLLAHFHGYDAHNTEVTEPLRASYHNLFQKCAGIIGVSRKMCGHLVSELGAPASKVSHIPCSVDPEKFTQTRPALAPPTVLCVGRFVEKKAPHLAIIAFSKALKEVPMATLEMVGDGPLLGACVWLTKSLGISDNVVFHGAQKHSWVADKMAQCRVFAQHSVTALNGDSEGTPVAVMEAQICGLPVVATRHAGISDVVIDEATGFLCDEGDVDGMARHLQHVLSMEGMALETISSRARENAITNFSLAVISRKLTLLANSVTRE